MKHFLLVTLSLLFFWQTGFSQTPQTFYVSVNGDNTNLGTEASPWATIGFAITNTNVNAGDTIKVNPGAYSDPFSVSKPVIIQGIGEGTEQDPLAVTISNAFQINAAEAVLQNLILANNLTIASGGDNVLVLNSTILGAITVNSGVSGVTLNENDLSGASTPAIVNNSGNIVNASYNWWGSAEKADLIGKIDPGTVAYSPWLNQADDTSLQVGFQPDLSSVSVDSDSPGAGTLQTVFDAAAEGSTLRLLQGTLPYDQLTVDKDMTVTTGDEEQPEIQNITVQSDTLSVDGTLLFSQSVTLNSGAIETINVGEVTLGTAVGDINEDVGRLRGNFTIDPRSVGTGEINILGVDIEPGPDDIGSVVVTRVNGPSGVVQSNGNESIGVTWFIESDNPPTNGRTVKFRWWAEDDNNEEGVDQVQVWRFDEAQDVWELVTPDAISAATGGTNLRLVTVNNVTEFSPWTISDVAEPLPVTLVDFTARLDESSVRLDWSTATETNAHFFGIERSTDGLFFDEIARNQAVGESSSLRNYLYIDEGVASRLTGTLYYRLRMVDFDETFEYSNIIAVSLTGDNDLRVYADASAGTLKLFTQQLPAGNYLVQVSDVLGNVLIEYGLTATDENSIFTFPLSSPTRSVYVVRCFGAQALYTQKFKLE
jgi:hypothetical protein